MKKTPKLMFVTSNGVEEISRELYETIKTNLSFDYDMNLSTIVESRVRNFAMTLAFYLNSRYDDMLLFERIKAFTEDYIRHHK